MVALFGAFVLGSIFLTGGRILSTPVAHASPVPATGSCSVNVISGSVNKPNPSVGDTIVYTFSTNTLGGAGVQASTTIVLANDTMPTGLTFVSSSTSGGPFSGTWSGGTVTITITATVDATGTISYVPSFAYSGNDCAAESMTNPDPVVINASSLSAATSTLIVVTDVTNDSLGTKSAADFSDIVTGTNVTPSSTIAGSATGTTVTLTAGSFSVAQAASAGYDVNYSADCSGTIAAGQTKTCTVTDNDKSLPAPVCSMNGLYGYYYNLPETLSGMEGAVTGVTTDTAPLSHGWYVNDYFSFASNTPITSFDQPSNFFPVNDGLSGDPFYAAIHWTGSVTLPASGTYQINLGSDDDSWLYINGQLVDSVPGTHPLTYATSSYTATASTTVSVDLYFAERHTVQSGIVFQMPGAIFSPCAPVTPTSTSADISINKTVDNTNPGVEDTVKYTVTVTNNSTSTTSTDVVASDTLPSTLTFEHATASASTSFATSTGIWTIGTLAPSSTATLQIAALVNSGDAGDTITNTATVSASTTDPDMSNNSSSIPLTVSSGGCSGSCGAPNVDLAIKKIEDVTSTFIGDPINYTIVVTNLSSSTASIGVVATDTLPSGLTFEHATASASTSYASSTGTWTIGTLAPSSTATLQIAALVTGPGVSTGGSTNSTITNTATVGESSTLNDPDTNNNSSSISVLIGPALPPTGPDLVISKTVDNANPAAGDDVNYTILVANNGSATSTFVEVQDALPLSLSVVSSTISQGSSTNAGTFDWSGITLAPNATATLVLEAAVGGNQAGQSITNTATVFSQSDPSLVASSSVTINVQPAACTSNCGGGGGGGGGNIPSAEIGIVKTVDNADPATGSTIHYTLTVNATGPSASFGVAAKDVLPAGLTFVSATPSEGSYVSSTGTWTIGTLAAGHDATLVIAATVTAPNNTKISNTATVSESPTVIDPLSGNDSSTVTINVGGQVLGASTSTVATSTGQVLGESCGLYLTSYIHPNRQNLNDPAQVKKLQIFLNQNLGLSLPVDGVYDSSTIAAVDQFQVKYHNEVLHPWTPLGLPTEYTPTGYVYQTTQRWINLIMCPALNLSLPALKVDNSE